MTNKRASKCCGAEVLELESGMPNSGFIEELYINIICSKCHKPCETKEAEDEG